MPTQSQPTALPKHTPVHTLLADVIVALESSRAFAKYAEDVGCPASPARASIVGLTAAHTYLSSNDSPLRAAVMAHPALVAENKRLREALEKAQSFISNGREIAESGHETECAAEFAGSYCERLLARIRAALAKEDV